MNNVSYLSTVNNPTIHIFSKLHLKQNNDCFSHKLNKFLNLHIVNNFILRIFNIFLCYLKNSLHQCHIFSKSTNFDISNNFLKDKGYIDCQIIRSSYLVHHICHILLKIYKTNNSQYYITHNSQQLTHIYLDNHRFRIMWERYISDNSIPNIIRISLHF